MVRSQVGRSTRDWVPGPAQGTPASWRRSPSGRSGERVLSSGVALWHMRASAPEKHHGEQHDEAIRCVTKEEIALPAACDDEFPRSRKRNQRVPSYADRY